MWSLEELPQRKRVVDTKWVFTIKLKGDGTIDRYKARLVARGFKQKEGIDYKETFSPVARFETVRAVLSVAVNEDLILAQFDVKTAFLNGCLEEEVYIKQPVGFEDGSDRVCRLKKSLYGLKQAPRCWNQRLTKFLKSKHFVNTEADPCLYIRNRNENKLIVVIYVDDGLVAGSNQEDINEFLSQMESEFEIKKGNFEYFLGVSIMKLQDGSLFLSQKTYARKILERFNMSEANAVSTPALKFEKPERDEIETKVPFRECVGSLMYLMLVTRPDITYAVSYVGQYLEKPSRKNWSDVKRILRYIKGTLDCGLVFKKVDSPVLEGYADADFASDENSRLSRSGFIAQYGKCSVSWFSRKQTSVVLSTTESEYVASSEGARELMWLQKLLSEITEVHCIPKLFVDNNGAVKLSKSSQVFHKRSKHIDVRHHYVRDMVENNKILLEHISGEKQLADVMTKPLPRPRFAKLIEGFNIVKEEVLKLLR